ncbi:chemotaxis protein CheA, partial [Flavobacterium sp. UBA6046]|uniref:chemotaxis protein CheA n=1 Tax=Flavobacterium sp. UBA6046 TaxID=1946552 RepID=UPI0025BC9332
MKSKGSIAQSIRVNQVKLDKMMNMISELVIAKNSFMHISAKLNLEYDLPEMSKEVKQVGTYVNRISDELQNAIMSIRMVEIKTVFQKMPRVIRDIAQSTGKKMELHMEGESTEIDKTIIDQISDPLVHLIRNSADHGVEDPEERLLKGKPETGKIILRAYNKNKHVFIEIEDDGKGIDAEKLKTKAIEKGIISEKEAEIMNQNQLINLIFLPGFSMAKKITEVSGRGVGMDIVKSNIAKINGNIKIESEVDKGTKMIIRLPLTLAVSRGLIVEVTGETYIVPLEYIVETVKIDINSLHKFNGKFFTCLRGDVIGIEWLCKIFLTGERDTEKEEINAVILSNGVENYAIAVDKLINEQEFVVKTLEGPLAAIPGISGSTLLGNGQVVLIVNPAELLQSVEK